MSTDRKPQVYRDVIDGMVHACRHGQGQIGPRRANAGVWNQNATEDFIPEQHEINVLLSRLSADDRRIVAGMLEHAFSGGAFEALKVLEQFEIEPFRDGYEGSPYEDFIGRLQLPDWEWPMKDDPQNPLHRRVFVIRPRAEYFAATRLPLDHPSSEPAVILTPRLPIETWYEGWGPSWRRKAKQDFIADFADLWATAFPFESVLDVPEEFLARLRDASPPESVFDQWWSLEENRTVQEIDELWRPS